MTYSYGKNNGSSKLTKILSIAIGLFIILLAVGWWWANNWYQSNLEPLTAQSNEKVVVIELGSSTSEIAEQLEDEPIIKSARAFSLYVSRLDGEQVIQAGTYRLDSNMPVSEIVEILVNGRVDTNLVTIKSGLRLDEVRQVLINAGFDQSEVTAALSKRYGHPLERYIPGDATLEGYIYPDTYQITASSTPETIVQLAMDNLYKQLTPSLINGLENQNLSVHQAINLASIVQKESSGVDDMPGVAQVFLKRLDENIALGADATFRYAAAVTGQEPTIDIDSPYNTRLYPGLPPGPISNLTIEALIAVAEPADSDYLYFLHGDDCLEPGGTCTTYYANTQAEHEANAAKYCRENCRL